MPERLAGRTDDGRSDVFSLGTTLYQMICAPSLDPSATRPMASGETGDLHPLPMEQFRPGVPEVFESLVRQARRYTGSAAHRCSNWQ